MAWSIDATASHLSYLILATFLISYALFSAFIRNRLHLSEPPLALLAGIAFGPKGLNFLNPTAWAIEDSVTIEFTRLILGIQVFAVGVELPRAYLARHWKSVGVLLGPVMTFSWLISAALIYFVLNVKISTALIISACLAPTDPVLAASVLNNSQFSERVPRRLKHMLSAESGCNDGVSFPFLFAGVYLLTEPTFSLAFREWFTVTILWECTVGLLLGLIIGWSANHVLRMAERKDYIDPHAFLSFYILLALFNVGVGSTLAVDDFLTTFGAGVGFGWDGWFAKQTKETSLLSVLDLLLNSTMFVYLGTIIPWSQYTARVDDIDLLPSHLILLLVLILVFRRIPAVLATYRFIPDIKTWREALFCGHFGPMGLGAIFLAVESQDRIRQAEGDLRLDTIWPVVSFIVLGSTFVHGLSAAVLSTISHFSRPKAHRNGFVGGETDRLTGMNHEDGDGDSEPSVDSDSDPDIRDEEEATPLINR